MKKYLIVAAACLMLLMSLVACADTADRAITPALTPAPANDFNRGTVTVNTPAPVATAAPGSRMNTVPKTRGNTPTDVVTDGRTTYPSAMTTPGGYNVPPTAAPRAVTSPVTSPAAGGVTTPANRTNRGVAGVTTVPAGSPVPKLSPRPVR